jgi:heat shock protein HslJ
MPGEAFQVRRAHVRAPFVVALVVALAAACSSVAPSATGQVLTGKAWQWTASTLQGATTVPEPSTYTLEFLTDGTFASQVDCNRVAGTFTTTGSGGLTIKPGPSTLAACPEGSLADAYLAGLSGTTNYAINGSQLVLTNSSGTMTFS